MNISKENLVEEIKMYLSHITVAHDYYIAWKTLVDSVNSKEFNGKINMAPAFFSVTLNALFDSLQLELSKLYCDTQKNEKTINKLINIAEANANLFPTDVVYGANIEDAENSEFEIKKINIKNDLSRAKKDLEELKPIIENINTRRDKKIAHNDKKYFLCPREIYIDTPLTMSELHALICFAGDFCNKLLCYLNESIIGYNCFYTEDLKNLLEKTSHN